MEWNANSNVVNGGALYERVVLRLVNLFRAKIYMVNMPPFDRLMP